MTRSFPLSARCGILLALFFAMSEATSQWVNDPTVNTPVCTADRNQRIPTIASDGLGGAIIAWHDLRNLFATSADIYAQRIDPSGTPQWLTNGVVISGAVGDQTLPQAIPDGSGGAIIVWEDDRATAGVFDVYVQSVNAQGVVQWTPNGVPVCTASNNQREITVIPDGSGGAIITWNDTRSGSGYDIFAQRISGSGATLWAQDGIPVSVAAGDQKNPKITTDGAGGAIISWVDYRSGTQDIYAQRLNASGSPQWTMDGVPVVISGAAGPVMVSDDAGGAIIAWGGSGIWATRINGSGAGLWTGDRVALSSGGGDKQGWGIERDGAGGAIVVWEDLLNGPNEIDILAQRIAGNGTLQWGSNGIGICTAQRNQTRPAVIADGSSGAIITWNDDRFASYGDLFAQRTDNLGQPLWTNGGVAISKPAGVQTNPVLVAGAGGAIITWEDQRVIPGGTYDIYAQRVTLAGELPVQLSSFTGSFHPPHSVRLAWRTLSELNNYGFQVERKQHPAGEWTELPGAFLTGYGTTNEPHAYEYTDSTAFSGSWEYRLKQIDLDGSLHYSEPIVVATPTDIRESNLPRAFNLEQNFPNPFNPITVIRYQIPQTGHVRLRVYNLLGKEVATLVDGIQDEGMKSITLDGHSLSSGVYLYRLESGTLSATKKLVLMK